MNGDLGKEYLQNYKKSIDPILNDFLSKEIKESHRMGNLAEKMMAAFKEISSGGKRLRGALLKLGYEACGGKDIEKILNASLFTELFHTAILIQDDFMDKDPFRRGIKAVHVEFAEYAEELKIKTPPEHYGNSVATCLGDAGLYLSWKALLNSGFLPENIVSAGKFYSSYITRLSYGQSLDMTIVGEKEPKEKDVLNVMWLKSGEYTALMPLHIGAILAGEKNERKINALKKYAECFGWAFQIQDDLLGTFGEEEKLGKPVGSDLREGKSTLLVMHLKKNGTSEQKKFIDDKLGNPEITDKDVENFKKILVESGSYDYVLNKGWKYVKDGEGIVDEITSDKKLQSVFISLLYYMMERTK